jgi:hypothetical protein
MADLTVTAANVRPLPGAVVIKLEAAAAIDIGTPVYLSAAGEVTECDASVLASSQAIGVVVGVTNGASATAAADGESVDVCVFGPIAGCDTTYNALYYVDDDAGVMADAAGTDSCIVGIGLGNDKLLVRPQQVDLTEQG